MLKQGAAMSTSSTTTPRGEDSLIALQGVVHRKLGECLIRLQQYELLMKDFVTRAHVEGPTHSIAEMQADRAGTFAQQTLGQVVGAFTSTVLDEPEWDADGFPPYSAPEDQPAWIISGFNIGLPDDVLEGTRAGLAAFVTLRNDLVHGFVARHDLCTKDGCLAAVDDLDASYEVIDQRFIELRGWHTSMLDLSKGIAEMSANPEFQDHFFRGILPDGAGIDWPASTIVGLLLNAEAKLAQDGWTSLENAVALIRTWEPGHTPQRYGCSTWRQVLHESAPLFTVRRIAGDRLTPGRTWYQSRRPPASVRPARDR
jgi:hypothetical protein